MEEITQPEKEKTEASTSPRERYILFAIIAFILIAFALVFILSYSEPIIITPTIGMKDVQKTGIIDSAADRPRDSSVDTDSDDNSGIIAIFRGDTPVPDELNMTLNQYIDRYLYGCYYTETDSEKIDCYSIYYFNVDNPVKEQYDTCTINQNHGQNQRNPSQECMDKVYDELASYIGKLGCERIYDTMTKQACMERAE